VRDDVWRVRTWTGGSTQGEVELGEDERITVGRAAKLTFGRAAQDPGISRVAAAVTVHNGSWRIEMSNANGATLHPWGLAPTLAGPLEVLAWSRVGLRLRGSSPDTRHWLLLETDRDVPPTAAPTPLSGGTAVEPAPLPLSQAQERALRMVFAPQLAWPPSLDPPLQIKQVARQLGVSNTAVQNLLRKAQDRALRLGLTRPVELTQPDYLHVLVAAGYVR
jgi:hypothetical protein